MSERDMLLRAILDRPGDDTARVVFADKLEELGGAANAARAQFIRKQVESARLEAICAKWASAPGGTEEDAGQAGASLAESQILEREAGPLLKKWGAGWIPPHGRKAASLSWQMVRNVFGEERDRFARAGTHTTYEFHRGFIRTVTVEPDLAPLDPKTCAASVVAALAAHPVEVFEFAPPNQLPRVTLTVHRLKRDWRAEWKEVYGKRDVAKRKHKPIASRAEFCGYLSGALPIWFAEVEYRDLPIPF